MNIESAARSLRWVARSANVAVAAALPLMGLAPFILAGADVKLRISSGHPQAISSAVFSADSRLLLTAAIGYPDHDHAVSLWDVDNASEIRRFSCDGAPVRSPRFSPDGQRVLAICEGDHAVRVWDIHNQRRYIDLALLPSADGLITVAEFARRGTEVLTSTQRGLVQAWDASSGRVLRALGRRSRGSEYLATSPDGRILATLGRWSSSRVDLWDLTETRLIRALPTSARQLAFSPDGRFLATGDGHTIQVWDTRNGRETKRFTASSEARAMQFSGDGTLLAVGPWELLDLETGKKIQAVREGLWSRPELEPDDPNGCLVTGFGDQPCTLAFENGDRIHSARLGSYIWEHNGSVVRANRLTRLSGGLDGHEFDWASPDGRFLLSQRSSDRKLNLCVVSTRECRDFATPRSYVTSLSSSGSLLLAAVGDKPVVWDLDRGVEKMRLLPSEVPARSTGGYDLVEIAGRNTLLWNRAGGLRVLDSQANELLSLATVKTAAISRDGKILMACTGEGQYSFVILQPVREILHHKHERCYNGVVTTGTRLVVLDADRLEIRNIDTWAALETPTLPRFFSSRMLFSPNGKALFMESVLYDLDMGRVTLDSDLRIWPMSAATFSQDGTRLATVDEDGFKIWDTNSRKELNRFAPPERSMVFSLAFSSDGRYLFAGSENAVTIWDPVSGKLVLTLISFEHGGWVVVDPSGRYDASDPDHVPGVSLVAGTTAVEIAQLKARFYTPRLLPRTFRGDRLPEVRDLWEVPLPPRVELRQSGTPTRELTVILKNQGGGIGKVTVKLDGRELPPRAIRLPNPSAASEEIHVDLRAFMSSVRGRRVVEAFAANAEGSVRSAPVSMGLPVSEVNRPRRPRMFAVVIGVSDFADASLNLKYAAKDAVNIAESIRIAGSGMLGKEYVDIRLLATGQEREPTKDNIESAFREVMGSATVEDLLVVYLAGHGITVRGDQDQDEYLYLTCEARDLRAQRDSRLRIQSSVSGSELSEWLRAPNMPMKQVVILDTCAAGSLANRFLLTQGRARSIGVDQRMAIDRLRESTGSWILMGSDANSESYELSSLGQGLLTSALLEGMKGLALNGDELDISRLFSFVERRVGETSKGVQRPMICVPGGQSFPIGILDSNARLRIPTPAKRRRPLMRVQIFDEDHTDRLDLEASVRRGLMEASAIQDRSDPSREAFEYLDGVVDKSYSTLLPQVRYSMRDSGIEFRLRLLSGDHEVVVDSFSISREHASLLVRQTTYGPRFGSEPDGAPVVSDERRKHLDALGASIAEKFIGMGNPLIGPPPAPEDLRGR